MSRPNDDSPDKNVIIDRQDSTAFDVDWETIEKNCDDRRHHRHHRHHSDSSGHHTSEAHSKSSPLKKSGHNKKWSLRKKILIGILLFFLCILIGLLCTFLLMRYRGRQALLNYDNLNVSVPDGIDYEDNGRIIHYNGHTYQFNPNIATLLFMGVDNTESKENATAGTAGQADALYLLTYDTVSGAIRILCLNRDTMTDISRYDEKGNYYDTASRQLCLAYAYGDGKALSAQNQVTAVERLLYNIPINAYYAIDLSAIKILNDDIGGVTLTPEYTFLQFVKGQQITIQGDMAESFVRYRDIQLVDDNLRRMACQRLYINAFASQLVPAIQNDFALPYTLYQHTADYTVTNINVSNLVYLGSDLAMNFSGLDLIQMDGSYQMVSGDQFAEFHADKTSLFETVLDLFYIKDH